MRNRLFQILNPRPDVSDPVAWRVNQGLLWLIVLNITALVLETVEWIYNAAPTTFLWVERGCVAVFTVEYAARLWVCTEDPNLDGAFKGRLRYSIRTLPLFDLLAILPAYISLGVDLRALRIARLLRLLRVAKLGRYSKSLQMLVRVVKSKRAELATTVCLMLLLLLMASSLIYFVERDAQPEVFSSIPASMWWGVATLTTVGYGDVYPVTSLGKLLGAVVAMLGVGLFALPTGLLGAAFIEEVESRRLAKCPHCGEPLTDDKSSEAEGR